jgi:hypothetical protein
VCESVLGRSFFVLFVATGGSIYIGDEGSVLRVGDWSREASKDCLFLRARTAAITYRLGPKPPTSLRASLRGCPTRTSAHHVVPRGDRPGLEHKMDD